MTAFSCTYQLHKVVNGVLKAERREVRGRQRSSHWATCADCPFWDSTRHFVQLPNWNRPEAEDLSLCSCLLWASRAQWRTQNFRMGGVKVPQAPRGRGVGRGGNTPSPLGKCLARGAVPPPGGCAPSPRKFFVFLLKIPYFDAFWHVYFLNHTSMGGVLTPRNPLLGTPLLVQTCMILNALSNCIIHCVSNSYKPPIFVITGSRAHFCNIDL